MEYLELWMAEMCVRLWGEALPDGKESDRKWAEMGKGGIYSDFGTRVPGQELPDGAKSGENTKKRKAEIRSMSNAVTAKVQDIGAGIGFIRIRVAKALLTAAPTLTTNIASGMEKKKLLTI